MYVSISNLSSGGSVPAFLLPVLLLLIPLPGGGGRRVLSPPGHQALLHGELQLGGWKVAKGKVN
jgi:hypothetical protein